MGIQQRLGTVTSYDAEARTVTLHIDHGTLSIGDTIHIVAPGVDVRKRVEALLHEQHLTQRATTGSDVTIQLDREIPKHAEVFVQRLELQNDKQTQSLREVFRG